jgi:predicted transcriptional regulator
MNRHSSVNPSGAELRKSREAVGLSRIGLAYKAEVDLRTIERIEADEVTPRRSTLVVIEGALQRETEKAA